MHLPWSPGLQNDDRVIENIAPLLQDRVIVTKKMDGECTTLKRDHIYARSPDSRDHPSRAWIKRKWGEIRYEIPEYMRVCGENLFATHSIHYTDLPSYFMVFNVWDAAGALSWDETEIWAALFGLSIVPVLYDGPPSLELLENMHKQLDLEKDEGFVVRAAGRIFSEDWSMYAAKWVRGQHVQTDEHWMHQPVVPNELKKE